MSNMASTMYLFLFIGVVIQSVTSKSLNEWNVERSSVNPLSYTDEVNYSRGRVTESPVLTQSRNEWNCPENEELSRCDYNCQRTCDNLNKPFYCPKTCIWGCVCNEGLVRGPDKKCIEPKECPSNPQAEAQHNFCPSGEEFSPSHSHCEGNCIKGRRQIHKCKTNTKLWVPGCTCKSGLIRGPNGTCIRATECPLRPPKFFPIKICPENEVHVKSRAHCQRNCTNLNSTLTCEEFCQSGCVCKGSMVRGKYGKCVEQEKCPKIEPFPMCPENEVWDDLHGNCQRNCTNLHKDLKCKDLKSEGGCVCKGTLVRGEFGKCIERDDCPVNPPEQFCPKREEFSTCHAHCEGDCVRGRGRLSRCFKETEIGCVPGCTCKAGFFRGPDGTCIQPNECPTPRPVIDPKKVCPEKEVWDDMHANCQRNCTNLHKDLKCKDLTCLGGCVCKGTLVRGEFGKCIERDDCPVNPPVCGINEEFQQCGSACPANCTNLHRPQPLCPAVCMKGCFCKRGFVRDSTGKCILAQQCPVVCGPFEDFKECGSACPANCTHPNFKRTGPNTNAECVVGCFCRLGFLRNRDGKCVPPALCSLDLNVNLNDLSYPDDKYIPESVIEIKPIESEDEEFADTKCSDVSEAENIPSETGNSLFEQTEITLNSDTESQEKKFCPKGEEYSICHSHCESKCNDEGEIKNRCQKNLCVPGCKCEADLVRGPNGTCIIHTECPQKKSRTKKCPENEIYDHHKAACQRNCSNLNSALSCPHSGIAGCICREPMIRSKYGKCVEPDECPKEDSSPDFYVTLNPPPYTDDDYIITESITRNPQFEEAEIPPVTSDKWPVPWDPMNFICPENETVALRAHHCPPDDCNNFRNKDRDCSLFYPTPRCVCKNRFVLGPDGKCIQPYDCPKEKNFCPKGEEFSPCESNCEGDCDKGESNKDACIRGGMLCVPGCACKAGLVRGLGGTCISLTRCPQKPKVCPENEVFDNCDAACQKNCSSVHSSQDCPKICMPGCVCKKSMVRGIYGKCAALDECPNEGTPPEPSHDCPPRERWVPCGAHCQRNCSNKDDKDFHCRPVCIPGCICEDHLVRGPEGKCIERDECPTKSDSEDDNFQDGNNPCPDDGAC